VQRTYYAWTAAQYDDMEQEHLVALQLLAGFVEVNGIRSVLDIGAGTDRAMGWIKSRLEPVENAPWK
jgi:hypothetical protein